MLRELGDFDAASELLLAPTLAEVEAALESLAARAPRAEEPASIVFYCAGHGDAEALQLGRQRLARDELTARLANIPAHLVLIVLDACRTPAAQPRGLGTAPSMEIGVVAEPSPAGRVLLASTQEGAPALESESLGGAIFTHYWVSALQGAGDSDADGHVTLEEAYTFASHQTLGASRATDAPLQRPSFDWELEGSGTVVLTTLDRARAWLSIPPSQALRILVFRQQTGALVAEVIPDPERGFELAVPTGRLLLQRRMPGHVDVAELHVGSGERVAVDEAGWVDQPYEEVALRGGTRLVLGGGPLLRWTDQQRQRLDAERLMESGLPTLSSQQQGVGAGLWLGAGWHISLGQHLEAVLSLEQALLGMTLDDGAEQSLQWIPSSRARLGAGGRF